MRKNKQYTMCHRLIYKGIIRQMLPSQLMTGDDVICRYLQFLSALSPRALITSSQLNSQNLVIFSPNPRKYVSLSRDYCTVAGYCGAAAQILKSGSL